MADDERSRIREPEPEQKTNYEKGQEQYRNVRERQNYPYVVRDEEISYEQNAMGRHKFYSYPAVETSVLPDMKVFKHQIKDKSGRHTHQGGYTIYAVDGEGETLVDGERIPWSKGDIVVLPFKPGGIEHQHFNRNDPDEPAVWLATNWNPYHLQTGAMFKQEEDAEQWSKLGYDHHDDDDHDHDHDDDQSKVSEFMEDFSYQDWRDYEPPEETETLYEDLMVRRNKFRKQMAVSQDAGNWAVVSDDDAEWEWTPQGKLKWLVHPAQEDRSLRALMFSKQEIPPGSKSGKQLRQGGLIHFMQEGQVTSVVDGDEWEWGTEDYLGLPVKPDGVTVQHINEDPENPARFIRVEPFIHEAVGYDLGCGWEQLEDCPEWDGGTVG